MRVGSLAVEALRSRFPALARRMNGRPCVFADAPGGTQVPRSVIEAMADYLATDNANTGGAFDTSRHTDLLIAEARGSAGDLLGVEPERVAFGPSMTTLAFAVSRSVARELRPGDEVVVTRLDHDANIAPWLLAAEEAGATVRWVDVRDGDCTLDEASLEAALGERTRLVAFTLASNAVGTLTPAEEIVRLVRRRAPQALVVADAVHAAPHRGLSVDGLGVDVLFCSPYKFFGPHLGVMAGRRDVLERLRPPKVRPADDALPWRWETGTLSHEALAGLVAAIAYLEELGGPLPTRAERLAGAFSAIGEHEALLSRRFLEGLAGLPRVRCFGISDPARIAERTPTFALRIEGRTPREVAEAMGERGVFVWDGNYYALAIMERLGLEATGGAVRIGFCHYHTAAEVDRVLGGADLFLGPGGNLSLFLPA